MDLFVDTFWVGKYVLKEGNPIDLGIAINNVPNYSVYITISLRAVLQSRRCIYQC